MTSTSDEKADSDDDEFMERMNVYLNCNNSVDSSATKGLEGILRRSNSNKTVKFAMDEAELQDAKSDSNRSRQELLSKISRLTDLLREAEVYISKEKAKRRKKEKGLLKLAKELKKRNIQKTKDIQRIEELEEKKKYLEHHWVLAQKELDQEKLLREKLRDESQDKLFRALKDEKEKYAKVVKDHEAKISELKETHTKQCDELCREILKANLEADRLYSQLNGAATPPRKSQLFHDLNKEKNVGRPFGLVVLSIIVSVITYAAYRNDMFSRGALCAPVMPGLSLDSSDSGSSFYAPWWAPSGLKEFAFDKVCSHGVGPTGLEWLPDGRDFKAIVTHGDKVVYLKRGAVTAEIFANRLRTWNRKGAAEDLFSLWSV